MTESARVRPGGPAGAGRDRGARVLTDLITAGQWQPGDPDILIVADAGYWNEHHMDEIVANKHIPVLVAPDKGSRGTPRKTWTGGRYGWMRAVLGSEHGGQRYRKRRQTIEPLFGDTKHNKGATRFLRRGRVKVRTEWRLQMMSHNLAKLYNHQIASLAA